MTTRIDPYKISPGEQYLVRFASDDTPMWEHVTVAAGSRPGLVTLDFGYTAIDYTHADLAADAEFVPYITNAAEPTDKYTAALQRIAELEAQVETLAAKNSKLARQLNELTHEFGSTF